MTGKRADKVKADVRLRRIYRIAILVSLCILIFTKSSDVYAAERIVDHNKSLETGAYMEPIEGYSFETKDEIYYIENDRFKIKVDPGIYVSDALEESIDKIMDILEETTGCSFYPKESPLDAYKIKIDKVLIDIRRSAIIPSASSDGITLTLNEAGAGEFTFEHSVIAHELLHTLQIRNYGSLGDVTTEGFAESYTGTIEPKLYETFGPNIMSNERENEIICINAYGKNECFLDVDYDVEWVNEGNVEKYFFLEPGHVGHESSYWIVEYIREKYGDEGLTKLMKALGKKSIEHASDITRTMINISNEEELEVVRRTLSESFVQDFYKWFKQQDFEEKGVKHELTGVKKINPGYEAIYPNGEKPILNRIHSFTYSDSLEIDYTKAFAFAQQILEVPCKGMAGIFSGVGKLEFYDQYGTLLYTCGSESEYSSNNVKVPYATRVSIKCNGTHDYNITGIAGSGSFDDVTFSDISCKDGPVIKVKDAEKKEKESDKPIDKKVKTEKELISALENGKVRGGKITVNANITITDYLTIPKNVQVVIKKGKKLKLKSEMEVYGKLSGPANGIEFNDHYIWLEKEATIKLGDITYSLKTQKDYSYSLGWAASAKLEPGTKGKMRISNGFYSKIYITTPENAKLENIIELGDMMENYALYQNKKKVSAKKIEKLKVK